MRTMSLRWCEKAIAGLHDKYDLHMTFEHYVSEEAGMPAVDQKLIRR